MFLFKLVGSEISEYKEEKVQFKLGYNLVKNRMINFAGTKKILIRIPGVKYTLLIQAGLRILSDPCVIRVLDPCFLFLARLIRIRFL